MLNNNLYAFLTFEKMLSKDNDYKMYGKIIEFLHFLQKTLF